MRSRLEKQRNEKDETVKEGQELIKKLKDHKYTHTQNKETKKIKEQTCGTKERGEKMK